MKQKAIRDEKDKLVEQALETIRNRIDQFGVSEPVIQREGTGAVRHKSPVRLGTAERASKKPEHLRGAE